MVVGTRYATSQRWNIVRERASVRASVPVGRAEDLGACVDEDVACACVPAVSESGEVRSRTMRRAERVRAGRDISAVCEMFMWGARVWQVRLP